MALWKQIFPELTVWNEIYGYLWQKKESSEQNLLINLPDTVVYMNYYPRFWFFTSKQNGQIMKKHTNNISKQTIMEAMLKGKKKSDIVAQFIYPENAVEPKHPFDNELQEKYKQKISDNQESKQIKIKFLTKEDLEEFLDDFTYYKSGILQKFIDPITEYNEVFQVNYSPKFILIEKRVSKQELKNTKIQACERVCTYDGPLHLSENVIVKQQMNENLNNLMTKLANHVKDISHMAFEIQSGYFYFKQDPQGRIWFMYAQKVLVSKNLQNDSIMQQYEKMGPPKIDLNYEVENLGTIYYKQPLDIQKAVICLQCGKNEKKTAFYDINYSHVIKAFKYNRKLQRNQAQILGKQLFLAKQTQQQQQQLQDQIGINKNGKNKEEEQDPLVYKDQNVPQIFRILHPKMTEEDYLKLKENQDFLKKTVQVCQACYLDLTEYFEHFGVVEFREDYLSHDDEYNKILNKLSGKNLKLPKLRSVSTQVRVKKNPYPNEQKLQNIIRKEHHDMQRNLLEKVQEGRKNENIQVRKQNEMQSDYKKYQKENKYDINLEKILQKELKSERKKMKRSLTSQVLKQYLDNNSSFYKNFNEGLIDPLGKKLTFLESPSKSLQKSPRKKLEFKLPETFSQSLLKLTKVEREQKLRELDEKLKQEEERQQMKEKQNIMMFLLEYNKQVKDNNNKMVYNSPSPRRKQLSSSANALVQLQIRSQKKRQKKMSEQYSQQKLSLNVQSVENQQQNNIQFQRIYQSSNKKISQSHQAIIQHPQNNYQNIQQNERYASEQGEQQQYVKNLNTNTSQQKSIYEQSTTLNMSGSKQIKDLSSIQKQNKTANKTMQSTIEERRKVRGKSHQGYLNKNKKYMNQTEDLYIKENLKPYQENQQFNLKIYYPKKKGAKSKSQEKLQKFISNMNPNYLGNTESISAKKKEKFQFPNYVSKSKPKGNKENLKYFSLNSEQKEIKNQTQNQSLQKAQINQKLDFNSQIPDQSTSLKKQDLQENQEETFIQSENYKTETEGELQNSYYNNKDNVSIDIKQNQEKKGEDQQNQKKEQHKSELFENKKTKYEQTKQNTNNQNLKKNQENDFVSKNENQIKNIVKNESNIKKDQKQGQLSQKQSQLFQKKEYKQIQNQNQVKSQKVINNVNVNNKNNNININNNYNQNKKQNQSKQNEKKLTKEQKLKQSKLEADQKKLAALSKQNNEGGDLGQQDDFSSNLKSQYLQAKSEQQEQYNNNYQNQKIQEIQLKNQKNNQSIHLADLYKMNENNKELNQSQKEFLAFCKASKDQNYDILKEQEIDEITEFRRSQVSAQTDIQGKKNKKQEILNQNQEKLNEEKNNQNNKQKQLYESQFSKYKNEDFQQKQEFIMQQQELKAESQKNYIQSEIQSQQLQKDDDLGIQYKNPSNIQSFWIKNEEKQIQLQNDENKKNKKNKNHVIQNNSYLSIQVDKNGNKINVNYDKNFLKNQKEIYDESVKNNERSENQGESVCLTKSQEKICFVQREKLDFYQSQDQVLQENLEIEKKRDKQKEEENKQLRKFSEINEDKNEREKKQFNKDMKNYRKEVIDQKAKNYFKQKEYEISHIQGSQRSQASFSLQKSNVNNINYKNKEKNQDQNSQNKNQNQNNQSGSIIKGNYQFPNKQFLQQKKGFQRLNTFQEQSGQKQNQQTYQNENDQNQIEKNQEIEVLFLNKSQNQAKDQKQQLEEKIDKQLKISQFKDFKKKSEQINFEQLKRKKESQNQQQDKNIKNESNLQNNKQNQQKEYQKSNKLDNSSSKQQIQKQSQKQMIRPRGYSEQKFLRGQVVVASNQSIKLQQNKTELDQSQSSNKQENSKRFVSQQNLNNKSLNFNKRGSFFQNKNNKLQNKNEEKKKETSNQNLSQKEKNSLQNKNISLSKQQNQKQQQEQKQNNYQLNRGERQFSLNKGQNQSDLSIKTNNFQQNQKQNSINVEKSQQNQKQQNNLQKNNKQMEEIDSQIKLQQILESKLRQSLEMSQKSEQKAQRNQNSQKKQILEVDLKKDQDKQKKINDDNNKIDNNQDKKQQDTKENLNLDLDLGKINKQREKLKEQQAINNQNQENQQNQQNNKNLINLQKLQNHQQNLIQESQNSNIKKQLQMEFEEFCKKENAINQEKQGNNIQVQNNEQKTSLQVEPEQIQLSQKNDKKDQQQIDQIQNNYTQQKLQNEQKQSSQQQNEEKQQSQQQQNKQKYLQQQQSEQQKQSQQQKQNEEQQQSQQQNEEQKQSHQQQQNGEKQLYQQQFQNEQQIQSQQQIQNVQQQQNNDYINKNKSEVEKIQYEKVEGLQNVEMAVQSGLAKTVSEGFSSNFQEGNQSLRTENLNNKANFLNSQNNQNQKNLEEIKQVDSQQMEFDSRNMSNTNFYQQKGGFSKTQGMFYQKEKESENLSQNQNLKSSSNNDLAEKKKLLKSQLVQIRKGISKNNSSLGLKSSENQILMEDYDGYQEIDDEEEYKENQQEN